MGGSYGCPTEHRLGSQPLEYETVSVFNSKLKSILLKDLENDCMVQRL